MVDFEAIDKEESNGHDNKEDRKEEEQLISPQHLISFNAEPDIVENDVDKASHNKKDSEQFQNNILLTNNLLSSYNRQTLIKIHGNQCV